MNPGQTVLENFKLGRCFWIIFFGFYGKCYFQKAVLANLSVCLDSGLSLVQFVIIKPLSYCCKETIGFDVKVSFSSRPIASDQVIQQTR